MNTGAFGEGFPYSNFHELNMDWIIKIAKDFLDQYSNIQQTITDGLEELDTKAQQLQDSLDAWYTEHSEDIAQQLTDALQDLNDWYTLHQNYLDETLTEKITAFNTASDAKAAETIASIPDDYTELANEVATVDSMMDYITNPDINILNPHTVTLGSYMSAAGVETERTNFAHSDFIEVPSSTTVYGSYGLGSASYPTIVQFDSNKDVISDSAVFVSPAGVFNFTTTATTKYIVFNYNSSSHSASELLISLYSSTFTPYKVNGSGNVSTFNLFSDSIIKYDGNHIFSKSNIRLLTFTKNYNLGTSVTIGAGKFIYFDMSSETLYASNNLEMSKNVYLVGITNSKPEFFESLINRTFTVEYDAIENKVYIPNSGTGYLYVNGTYYTITGDPVTLTADANHFILCYNLANAEFTVTSSYSNIHNDDIIIMEAFSGLYNAICPVKRINNENAQAGTLLYTFGDSLTWYDGHQFTWGPHVGETCIGFQSYLSAYNKIILGANYGSSGDTTPELCTVLENNISNIDDRAIVTIMGGDNDDRLSIPVGTVQPVGGSFNLNTVAGALQHAIEALLTSKPLVRIVIMTEPIGWTYSNGSMKRVSDLIPNVYRQVANLYGLPLIDLWKESGINEFNRAYYYADPTPPTNTQYMYHPNNDGWKRLSKIICNEIMKM